VNTIISLMNTIERWLLTYRNARKIAGDNTNTLEVQIVNEEIAEGVAAEIEKLLTNIDRRYERLLASGNETSELLSLITRAGQISDEVE